ncbi:MAG: DUF6382 domain-containing protein [Eubacteriales bacterium]|nr:DUF6382 domain-containing protein [Eubacteriales bacterium]
MKLNYKRDLNHNYLVLSEQEIDTSSYQVRMMVSNVIPSLLKCRIQMLDDEYQILYDITSKQSLVSWYDEKKIKLEDIQFILQSFIQTMEETAEYLMNQENILLDPDCIFLDAQKKQLYFCYLPGHRVEVGTKFQKLLEYMLPLLDHSDESAVLVGYGVYRSVLEDSFQLEKIKEISYRIQEEDFPLEKSKIAKEMLQIDLEEIPQNRKDSKELWKTEEKKQEKKEGEEEYEEWNPETLKEVVLNEEERAQKTQKIPLWLFAILTGFLLCSFSLLCYFGYLPAFTSRQFIGVVVLLTGIAMGAAMIWKKINARKKPGTESEINRSFTQKRTIVTDIDDVRKNDEFEELFSKTEKEKVSDTLSGETEKSKIAETMPAKSDTGFEETMILSSGNMNGPSALISKTPGEFATIYLQNDIILIGKMESAVDAWIDLPTVSRIHAKIRKTDGEYYLTDLNSKNGTVLNGRILKGGEEYLLADEDEIEFAQARFVFLK